ncbi:MAG: hypothetical protein LBC99_07690 [Spirochaetota bacterium]|jgi:hypothetical protein|nr:hypothetical protein [Spirochaetota bacterium]
MRIPQAAALLILLVPYLGFSQTDSPSEAADAVEQTIVYEQYGIIFKRPTGWQAAPLRAASNETRERKLFDLIRVSLAPELPDTVNANRRMIHDAIQARAYLLVYEKSNIGYTEMQFLRHASDDIKNQGYELVTSKTGRENDISVITSSFRYRMPHTLRERDIWLLVRFFFSDKHLFVFYGSCRSEADQSLITSLFSGIAPITE